MANHPIVHVEIPAANTAEAAKFYNALFDWKMRYEESVDYHMFTPQVGPGGGFVALGDNKPGDVLVYVDSDDIDADLARVEQLGGKIVQPKMEIPHTGWFGIFTDPTGNRMALYTAMEESQG